MLCLKASLTQYGLGNAFKAFFLLSQTLSWAAGPYCFNRDGQFNAYDVPCNPSASQSVCCGDQWACLENGLCRSNSSSQAEFPNMYSQGSCTDATWGANECIHKCKDEDDLYQPCGGTTYCCGDCNCRNATKVDIPRKPYPYTTIGVLAPTSSSPFGSPVAPTSTPVAAPTDLSSSHSNNALKIGLGVSLSLAAIFLLCAAWYILKRERHWKGLVRKLQGLSPLGQGSDTPPAQTLQSDLEGVPQGPITPKVVTSRSELDCPNDIIWMQEVDSHTGKNMARELSTTTH